MRFLGKKYETPGHSAALIKSWGWGGHVFPMRNASHNSFERGYLFAGLMSSLALVAEIRRRVTGEQPISV